MPDLKGGRAEIAQGSMPSRAIVEPFKIEKDIGHGSITGMVKLVIN
jgi:hypothetical protein